MMMKTASHHHHPSLLVTLVVVVVLCCIVLTAQTTVDSSSSTKQECGVYLAPSTIPGAGLGMFAGQHFEEGDYVTDGDIVIPLHELDWHNDFQLEFFLWEEYTWDASTFPGMDGEIEEDQLQGCSTGIGAAINCMLPLVNVRDDWASMDSGNLHRLRDPGAGAITIYHDRQATAIREIVAGEELFISYGENYFESRENIYGLMPLERHYEEADELLWYYHDMMSNRIVPMIRNQKRSQEFQYDLYDLIKKFPFENRTINAFPENYTQIDHILEIGTAEQYHERSIRDLDWLEQHGQCMDNVRPGLSTIQGAGRGLFATRKIPKGSLVMPAPLIHIKDKEELRMYSTLPETEDGYIGRNSSDPNHWQLLLNYVYGHPESDILLSPYGMFNGLINHQSGRGANTKIQWSQVMRHQEWMEQDPDKWTEQSVSGLSWDFVATRDIKAGEEIFINYGQPWQDAWNQHVQNWVPPKSSSKNYVPGYEIDNNIELQLKTVAEGGYGPQIKVYCRSYYFPIVGLIDEYESHYYPCRIIHRYPDPNNSDETLYIAELVKRKSNRAIRQSYEVAANVLFGLPRDAFHFLDNPFTRDHQQTWSFRHEIMIPNELFPDAWKNREKNAKEKQKQLQLQKLEQERKHQMEQERKRKEQERKWKEDLEKKKKNRISHYNNSHLNPVECGIYLAPSTIPGAGLGMYAGKYYPAGEKVTDGDIIIPLPELEWHNDFQLEFFLWEEYTWSASTFPGMAEEVDYEQMQGASTGIGAAINCMLPLVNVEDSYSSTHSGNLHRSKNPGAGAISIFHDRKSHAYKDIAAGEELFISYGEGYFEARENLYGLMPFDAHYKKADALLSKYQDMLTHRIVPFFGSQSKNRLINKQRKLSTRNREKTLEMEADLYDIIKHFPFESRTINAFPENHTLIQHVLDIGTAEQYHQRSIRDLDWLNQHGKCMDNIRPGQSTIKEAGRGVFATRNIPKGSLVTPAPLIHIKDKEELRMYGMLPETEDGYIGRNSSDPNHWQLLLNYAYGHPESDILLSPYGMFNGLMNHHSTQANTKIQWSQFMRHPEWMEQDPEFWITKHVSGLSWDFIATRDIIAGEEIFIDYGQEWVTAWSQHLKTWKPPKGSQNYIPGYELDQDWEHELKTQDEGGYGPLIDIYCRGYFVEKFLPKEDNDEEYDYHRCRIINRYNDPNHHLNDGEPLYMVEFLNRGTSSDDTTGQKQSTETVATIAFGLPRSAFHFEDVPFTRDHQQIWAFRHEMMIPDELFPDAWKNKYK